MQCLILCRYGTESCCVGLKPGFPGLTLVASIPYTLVSVEIQRHSHFRVDKHGHRRTGDQVIQVAGLA